MHSGDRLLYDPLERLHLEDGVVLLDEQMGGIPAVIQDHVRLPVVGGNAPVNTPPKVLLGLTTPGKDGNVLLSQCGRNLVLSAVNIASSPTNL
jgi:hypothetical protein